MRLSLFSALVTQATPSALSLIQLCIWVLIAIAKLIRIGDARGCQSGKKNLSIRERGRSRARPHPNEGHVLGPVEVRNPGSFCSMAMASPHRSSSVHLYAWMPFDFRRHEDQ